MTGYDLGDIVPLSVEIRDSTGSLANGGTVTIVIFQPDGSAVGPVEVIPVSTGVYDYDFTPVMYGDHRVRWLSTGLNSAAFNDVFTVGAASVSLDEVKQHLNMTASVDDAELQRFVDVAVARIEKEVGPLSPRSVVETYFCSRGEPVVLRQRPIVSVDSIVSSGRSYTVLDPTSGVIRTNTWGPMTVSYTAGYLQIPVDVRYAILDLVSHLWRTQRGQTGGARAGLLGGEPDMPVPGANSAELPNSVLRMIRPYRQANLGVA